MLMQELFSETESDKPYRNGKNRAMSRIREIRKARGMTLKQLADQIGVTEVSASRYEKEDQRLTLPLLHKIAAALDCTPADLMGEAGGDSGPAPKPPVPTHDVDLASIRDLPGVTTMARDLPVQGTAAGGDNGDFELNGQTVDYVRRPPALAGLANAFAIYLVGDSMEPRFEAGNLLFVHPGRPVSPGCDVLIELHAEHGETGHCMVKTLVRQTAGKYILKQYNPPRADIEVPVDRVRHIYRVLRNEELLGV